MKKAFSLVLSLIMLFSVTAGMNFSVYALDENGQCGENVTYTFDNSTGQLTISGEGNMYDFYNNDYFRDNIDIKSVVINAGVTNVGAYAFYGCEKITSVSLPSGLTTIGSYAFYNCKKLTKITIPDSVTTISFGAFYDCERLTSVNIPDGITKIDDSVFSQCKSLTGITIPDSVTYIGDYAFYVCEKMTSISIPDGVTYIGKYAFFCCSALKTVKLPKNIKLIREDSFSGCNLNEIELPDGLEEIENGAFSSNKFDSVHIPDTVTDIGTGAFSDAISSEVYIPASVAYIGDGAFETAKTTSKFGFYEDFKVFGEKGSEAEKYAKANKLKFIDDINHVHNFSSTVGSTYKINDMTQFYACGKCACGYHDRKNKKAIYIPNQIVIPASSYYRTGKAIKPKVTVKDYNNDTVDSKYYDVEYRNNVNAGTAKITVSFKGMYSNCYNVRTEFKIKVKNLKNCNMNSTYTYTGKAIVPVPYYYQTVTKTDDYGNKYTEKVKKNYKKGTDYTITVSGKHKEVGKYTATIKFKGNYKGTVKKTFEIRPKPMTNLKTTPYSETSIKATWKKASKVDGYVVYRYNYTTDKWVKYKTTTSASMVIPRLNAADTHVYIMVKSYKKVGKKTYYTAPDKTKESASYTKPGKPTVKLKNIDFGEFKITYNRWAGHQVQISDNKSFSKKGDNHCYTYEDYNSSTTAYGWGSVNRYYVRAREYYYINGKLVVGPWSKTQTIVTY